MSLHTKTHLPKDVPPEDGMHRTLCGILVLQDELTRGDLSPGCLKCLSTRQGNKLEEARIWAGHNFIRTVDNKIIRGFNSTPLPEWMTLYIE